MIDPSSSVQPCIAGNAMAPLRPGRRRDATRDAAILAAAVDILVEVGFERMTVDMVAARAQAGKGALYRRWPSKAEMVLDAVAQMKRAMADVTHLPDTGTLRGDMIALFHAGAAGRDERFMRAIAGLGTLLAQRATGAETTHATLLEPWVDANRTLIDRSIARGETTRDVDVEVVAQVLPSMGGYRTLIQRRAFDLVFFGSLLDNVLLPILGIPVPIDPLDERTGGSL